MEVEEVLWAWSNGLGIRGPIARGRADGAARGRIPAVYPARDYIEAGGLIAYRILSLTIPASLLARC